MAIATSNRLLPLLGMLVIGITGWVLLKSCSDTPSPTTLAEVPTTPRPDADTPADTIKTLTANVSAMTAEMARLRQGNATLAQENQSLLSNQRQIEANVTSRLQQSMLAREREQEARAQRGAEAITSLTARVDALSQSAVTKTRQVAGRTAPVDGADIPIGLGLDGLRPRTPELSPITWIQPLEASFLPAEDAGGLLNRWSTTTRTAARHTRVTKDTLVHTAKEQINRDIPVLTVPRNATLMGSVAMTALVGRVPVQGQVRDPMPFKVITGKDNLAANGLTIPGVRGMIWSGTAIGDWTLSCVSGKLESVTFVFDDGTIRTLSSDDAGSLSGRSGRSSDRPLGWISDAQGIPCISGDRKTNAPAFLTQRMGVMALEAAAQAAAQAETTTLIRDTGTTSHSVTGHTGRFALGKTVTGGTSEIAKWLQERQAQNFDAVFVPAGVALAIHVDHELPIDRATRGRRLIHGPLLSTTHSPDLD